MTEKSITREALLASFGALESQFTSSLKNAQALEQAFDTSRAKLVQAKQAANHIFQDSGPLLEKTSALTEGYNGAYTGFFTWVSLAIIVCALLALACLALMAKTYNDDIARRRHAAERLRENARASYANALSGTDLIVGARDILAAVYAGEAPR